MLAALVYQKRVSRMGLWNSTYCSRTRHVPFCIVQNWCKLLIHSIHGSQRQVTEQNFDVATSCKPDAIHIFLHKPPQCTDSQSSSVNTAILCKLDDKSMTNIAADSNHNGAKRPEQVLQQFPERCAALWAYLSTLRQSCHSEASFIHLFAWFGVVLLH